MTRCALRIFADRVEIPLQDGTFAVVDLDDLDLARSRTWVAVHTSARRSMKYVVSAGGGCDRLHRLVLRAPAGIEVDHRDRDTMNCRRSNLRVATHTQNMRNRSRYRNNTSGFKGVYPFRGRWRAMIKGDDKRHCLGVHDSARVAAEAYDAAAIRLHGEFAALNFPRQIWSPSTDPTVPRDL